MTTDLKKEIDFLKRYGISNDKLEAMSKYSQAEVDEIKHKGMLIHKQEQQNLAEQLAKFKEIQMVNEAISTLAKCGQAIKDITDRLEKERLEHLAKEVIEK